MKSTVVILLVITMLALLCCAGAVGDEEADALKQLGLFQGTGTDAEGNPIFELEREPTRAEALVMLLRLMGVVEEAAQYAEPHPFNDVESWASPYVAYAYANGITSGTSKTTFGMNDTASAQMFVTFVLRALGYSDTGPSPDFTYQGALGFGVDIGLSDGDYDSFTRGNAAIIAYSALSQVPKGAENTLLDILMPPEPEPEPLGVWEDGVLTLGVTYYSPDYWLPYETTFDTLKEYMPELEYVLEPSNHISESDRYTYDEMEFLSGLSQQYSNYHHNTIVYERVVSFRTDTTYYFVDGDYNILAYCYVPTKYDGDFLRFYTDSTLDGSALFADYLSVVGSVRENFGRNDIQFSGESFDGWDGGTGGFLRYYPVTMNGSYLNDNWSYIQSRYSWQDPNVNLMSLTEDEIMCDIEMLMFRVFFESDYNAVWDDGRHENRWLTQGRYEGEEFPPVDYMLVLGDNQPQWSLIVFFTLGGEFLGHMILPPAFVDAI